MDLAIAKSKKGLIRKTWDRCRSIGHITKGPISRNSVALTRKSKSWPRMKSHHDAEDQEEKRIKKRRVAPEGCFSVYVGPQKQRFVIKTEYANHPLFKILLEEAELEYGYNSEGPIALPCNVELFCKVLVEMDSDDHDDHDTPQGCSFPKGYGSYQLLTPSRLVSMNQFY